MKGVSVMRIVDFIAMFYLNELISLVLTKEGTTFIHSHAKFHEDFFKFKKLFDGRLAEILRDYLILSSAKEILEAWENCDESPYYFLGKKIYFVRESILDNNIQNLNLKAYYEMAEYIFGKCYWSRLYGGEKWYKAIKILESYGKIDNSMFCDLIVDLQHNTGSILSKDNPYFTFIGDILRLKHIIQRKADGLNFNNLFEFLLEKSSIQDKRIFDIYWRFISLYITNENLKRYWLSLIQNCLYGEHYFRSQCEFFEYKPVQYIGNYKKYEIKFSDDIQNEYEDLNSWRH